jgi:PST family polysaccharide transporter
MTKFPPWLRLLPAFVRTRVEHRPGLQQALANTGWLFGDKILRMGVGLLVGVWVARYLGPAQFGLFSYATAFVALFGAVATLGLPGIVVRDLVKEPESAQEVLATAFGLQLLGGLLALALAVGVMAWLRPDDPLSRTMVAILGSALVLKATDVAKYWFEARVQSKYTVVVENTAFLLMAAGKVGLILTGAPLLAFVWITLGEAVLVAAGMLWIYRRQMGMLIRWQPRLARTRQLLRESWPLILSGLAVMVYMRIDQIMLGEMLGDDAVGIYSAAVRISEVWYFVPIAIVASVFPSIIEAKKIDEGLYLRRLQKLYDLMVLFAVAVALPLSFLSNSVVSLLYGSIYQQAGQVLAIHTWALVFYSLSLAGSKWFLAENRQILTLQRHILGVLTNVLFNLLLIPRHGVIGAAWATLIAHLVASLINDLIQAETRMTFRMKIKSLNLFSNLTRLIALLKERKKTWNSLVDGFCKPLNYDDIHGVDKTRINIESNKINSWFTNGNLEKFIEKNGTFHKKGLEFYFSAHVLKLKSNDRILDAAGGRSGYLCALRGNGCEGELFLTDHIYTGVTKGSDGVNIVGGDISAIHLADSTVDKIACHHAFEHFQDNKDTAFVKEAYRILRPGGALAIIPLFVTDKYVECWNCNNIDKKFDSEAFLLIDETASIPGGDDDGHFARIYDVKSLLRRVIEPAEALGFVCDVIECEVDNNAVPDMTNNFGSILNKPLRLLRMRKV